MEIFLNHYGVNRVVTGKLVDGNLCMIEWPILRSKMVIEKRKSGMTDAEFWRSHLTLEQPLTPSLDLLACIRLTTCLATVWCELFFTFLARILIHWVYTLSRSCHFSCSRVWSIEINHHQIIKQRSFQTISHLCLDKATDKAENVLLWHSILKMKKD